jgi:hypothetical protein
MAFLRSPAPLSTSFWPATVAESGTAMPATLAANADPATAMAAMSGTMRCFI